MSPRKYFTGVCIVLLLSHALRTSNAVPLHDSIKGSIRRLMGSNCLVIERGVVTKYFECIGCREELAVACIEDMRLNKSQNVPWDCTMNSLVLPQQTSQCCPSFDYDASGTLNLNYMGSAYPEALRCLENVGCSSSLIYSDLVLECNGVCNSTDPRTGSSVCFSAFNSSNFLYSIDYFCVIFCLFLLSTVLLLS